VKKRVSLVLMAIMLFSLLVQHPAFAADLDYLATGANYVLWAKMIYDIDIDDKVHDRGLDQDGLSVAAMDKLITYTNMETMEVAKISYIIYDKNIFYTKDQETQRKQKVLSFFSAIEGGDLLTLSNEEAISTMETASRIYEASQDLDRSQVNDYNSGLFVRFYATLNGTYYTHFEYMSREVVYFVPNGQAELGETSKVSISDVLDQQEEWSKAFKRKTKDRMKEYYKTELDDFSLTLNAENNKVQAMNVYFTWSALNGEDRTKKMLEMFSDDLAAYLHEEYPEMQIEQLTIFWKVPYLVKVGYAGKYQYSSKGDKMYRKKTLGVLYGKD